MIFALLSESVGDETQSQIPKITMRTALLLLLPSLASALRPPSIERRGCFATAVATTLVAASSPAVASSSSSPGGKIVFGDESIMSPKAHGTAEHPVQANLKYGVSNTLADRICNFNRHFAEMGGYFASTNWEQVVLEAKGPVTFYDSVTGKPLFVAPIGRPAEELVQESRTHGWPSFRDSEVVWDNVRVLRNSGETVSVDGTHLGHNLPDRKGNRYCINLVSIAGNPTTTV